MQRVERLLFSIELPSGWMESAILPDNEAPERDCGFENEYGCSFRLLIGNRDCFPSEKALLDAATPHAPDAFTDESREDFVLLYGRTGSGRVVRSTVEGQRVFSLHFAFYTQSSLCLLQELRLEAHAEVFGPDFEILGRSLVFKEWASRALQGSAPPSTEPGDS
ncbi:MAG: hypothetical protein IPL39_15860 [Opitutaceae bacterium]|nr:hypothetical protein [Opitutaceae bacterium]